MYRALRFSSGVIARSSLLASAYPRACRSCSGVCCALSLFSPEAEMTPPPASEVWQTKYHRGSAAARRCQSGAKELLEKEPIRTGSRPVRNFIFSAIF